MTFPIPREALDDRLAVVGTAGSGKTYLVLGAIEHLLTHSRPERLVLWNHASVGPRAQREREWQQFLDTYASLFPKGLPENGARCAFITFDPDWNPVGAPSRTFPLTLGDRLRLGNAPIFGFRSIVRKRLVG